MAFMSHTLDPQLITDNTLHFAAVVCQTLSDMIGHDYAVKQESYCEVPFTYAEGLVVFIHFGGILQGDYQILMSENVAAALLGSDSIPDDDVSRKLFREESVDLLTELLNTAVGQSIHKLEEQLGILSYVPAVAAIGSLFFPRVTSRRITVSGKCGDIECVVSINAGDLRIARRFDEMQETLEVKTRLAHVDRLTQLYNRSYYDEIFSHHVKEAERYENRLSLMIIDIDFFKQFNDKYGHQVGDLVLVSVAGAIRRVIRKCDVPVRFGGDEIIVLLPETDQHGGKNAAQRIVAALNDHPVECLHNGVMVKLSVTLSIGVSQYEIGDTVETLFARTDSLLYRAKESGRARIVASGDILQIVENESA